jgi:hypothetical protein
MNSKGSNMPKNGNDILGPIFWEISGEIARIVGGEPDGTYLYAEAGEGWVGAGVFKPESESVRYFDPGSDLSDLLIKAWKAEKPDKRWAVMEFEIVGTSFEVRFKLPEEIDVDETEMERRPRALRRRFGNKPVIYPSPPDQ